MARTLLVTGFGPFPTMPRNPSAELARRVAASPRWRLLEVRPRCLVLETSYRAINAELVPALARHPDAVLMIGVAGRSKRIRVETRATSRRSTLFPDAAGKAARGLFSGGLERRAGIVPAAMLRRLRQRRVPARLSRDAGRYLCNASYFRALAEPVPVLFIHIPKPGLARPRRRYRPTSAPDVDRRLEAALVDVAAALLVAARRRDVESARRLR